MGTELPWSGSVQRCLDRAAALIAVFHAGRDSVQFEAVTGTKF